MLCTGSVLSVCVGARKLLSSLGKKLTQWIMTNTKNIVFKSNILIICWYFNTNIFHIKGETADTRNVGDH